MNALTAEWVAKAENDFYSADLLLYSGEYPVADTSCFHSQQCAEKYLKAFLQEHGIPFERKHNLIPLLDVSLEFDGTFEILRDDLVGLEGFAVGVRYPGVIVTVEMAEQAFSAARRVREFVRGKLTAG